ncbi:MAG: DUF4293 domain-containing protein [Bacteroidaceae bacterium]|nr:DUF4293 domain-containing protein [Bacteroidaceae bacterium]
MIQRIQTLHLIMSVLAGIVALVLGFSCATPWVKISWLCLVGLGTLLILWSIFLYKNRMRQVSVVNLSTLCHALTGVVLGGASLTGTSVEWGRVALFLPLVAIIFNLLAARRIRFDERLVRSADRLR